MTRALDDTYACPTGKQRYPTRRRANIALGRQRAAGLPVIAVYQCGSCKGFHLTKRRESQRPPLELRRSRERAS